MPEWASFEVLAQKKDETVHVRVDYRQLNAMTVRDTHPLPRTDEGIDFLGDATIFSAAGCNSTY